MIGWFRMYDEVLDDPKVQKLPGDDFKAWVNLLCLARRNDGVLPAIPEIAFALRMDDIACRSLLDRLATAGLIDSLKGGANGSRIAPHGWGKRQYKSDGSTERVKRYRERYKTVSPAVTETPPDTESETDIPLDKSNGEIDYQKRAFALGVEVLGHAQIPPAQARSLVGKWRKITSDQRLADLIEQARGKSDPVQWIAASVNRRSAEQDEHFRAIDLKYGVVAG
jgi:hypothetical protein